MRVPELSKRLTSTAVVLASACGHAGAVPDGGVDAGPDGGTDAGRDGERDAGFDAARYAGPGTWIPLEGLPAPCNLEIAVDPGETVAPYRTEPCPGWTSGCRQLIVDWPRQAGLPSRFNAMSGKGAVMDGRGYFVAARPVRPSLVEYSVIDDAGRAAFALRSPIHERCALANLAIGEGRFACMVDVESPSDVVQWIGAASLDDPAGSFRWLTQFSVADHSNSLQDIQVGALHVAVGTAPIHVVLDVLPDGTRQPVGSFDLDGNPAYLKAVVQDAILYDSLGIDHTVKVSVGGMPGRTLVAPSGAEATSSHTNGLDLVWLQVWGRRDKLDFDRVELWTGPWTTRAATLAPHRVATMPFNVVHDYLDVGYGHVAIFDELETWGVIGVYRLDDGSRTELRAPAGLRFYDGGILYLGPEEMAVGVGPLTLPAQTTTVMFIRYDAVR